MNKNITATPANGPMQIVVGDDFGISIAITENGVVKPLTGYTFFAGADGLVDTPFTVSIVDALNGVISVEMSAANTETLYEEYQNPLQKNVPMWWLRWRDPSNKTRTLINGRLEIFRLNEMPSTRPLQLTSYELVLTQAEIGLNIIGVPGPSVNSTSGYNHTQSSANTIWTINHNLGFRPNIDAFSAGGVLMIGEVLHLDVNTAQITFNTPLTGSARCS